VCHASSVNPPNAKAKPHKVVNSDREQQQHKGKADGLGAGAAISAGMRKSARISPLIINSPTPLDIVIELNDYYEVLTSRSIQN
jgi:hypothetical protein